MTQEFLDFVDKMTPDLPEEETSQETTSLTEEEQRENLEALVEDMLKAQIKAEGKNIRKVHYLECLEEAQI